MWAPRAGARGTECVSLRPPSPGNTCPSVVSTGGPASSRSTPSSSSFSSSSPHPPSSSALSTCTTSPAPSRTCRCCSAQARRGGPEGNGGRTQARKGWGTTGTQLQSPWATSIGRWPGGKRWHGASCPKEDECAGCCPFGAWGWSGRRVGELWAGARVSLGSGWFSQAWVQRASLDRVTPGQQEVQRCSRGCGKCDSSALPRSLRAGAPSLRARLKGGEEGRKCQYRPGREAGPPLPSLPDTPTLGWESWPCRDHPHIRTMLPTDWGAHRN